MVSQAFCSPSATDSGRAASPVRPAAGPISLLIVDDRGAASARLAAELRPLRQVVSIVDSPEAAVSWLETHNADVVALCSESRAAVLEGARRIRSASDLPLIVIGPDGTAESRVGAFDSGAHDYIALPVHPAELDRRIRVLVRREQFRQRGDELHGPEGLIMYVRAYEVHVGAERLALTPKEFSILQVLLERRGEVVVPDHFSLAIWGYETFGSRNYVEAHVSRLRRKLRRVGANSVIRTVRGVGYVIR